MRDVALVVFARAPERGLVKTRLAREVGDDAALRVYRRLLARTAASVRQWQGPQLLVSTGDAAAYAGTGCEQLMRCAQVDGNLGTRLAAALGAGLQLAPQAIVIGTDCPALRCHHLGSLAAALAVGDAAFGPATDGGFWGLATGSERVAKALGDADLLWSHPRTLQSVRQRLHALGLTTQLGPTLSDVDTLQDLAAAEADGHLGREADLYPPSNPH